MKYAAGDIVGLLIFVGILIFQAVSHFINTAKEKKAQSPGQRNNPPATPPPARKPEPTQYDDPFDELMEALGKKPGQAPSQLPHPPQNRPTRPVPPLTPAAPMQGEGPMRKIFAPEPPAKPVVVTTTTPEPLARETAEERETEMNRKQSLPVFATQIDSHVSASQLAAENIAKGSTAFATQTVTHRGSEAADLSLAQLVAQLRNPEEVRRAIVMKEILSAPIALR